MPVKFDGPLLIDGVVQCEGGITEFRQVRVNLPGDDYHGQTGFVSRLETRRTCYVDIGGKKNYYCVGALEMVP